MGYRGWRFLAIAPLLAGCGGSSAKAPAASPAPSGSVVAVVQVENSAQSDPHTGLQKADVVYEYLAEGGITRFSVVYYDPSKVDRIGPVRSIRPTALRLREAYGGVIFFSGGSAPLMQVVHSQHVPEISEDDNGDTYFQRDPSRAAPHNLFTTGQDLAKAIPLVKGALTYIPPGPGSLTAAGKPALAINFQETPAHRLSYRYSDAARAYTYTSERGPLIDAGNGNQPVEVTNVVLIEAPHKDFGYADVNGVPVIDFDLSVGGIAAVFNGGKRFDAKWDAVSAGHPPTLKSADGKDLKLPAGLTWVHIVDPGTLLQVS
jgi:hypothetical protein